jgi:glyoxylase-like metal-dependent hydrolase (beta-lactamase superfamily II)
MLPAGAESFPRDLGNGAVQFQTPLWETNSLLVERDGEILLCDPAFTEEEIQAIGDAVEQRRPSAVRLVATHADFDHVCGIHAFPDAEVIAGTETAERIRGGVASQGMDANGPDWNGIWPSDLRVDTAVEPGTEVTAGAFRLAAIDAPSHGREGTAWVLVDDGILLPGDHISSMTIPYLGGPLRRAIEANRRLIEAVDSHELRWVVPGHGPALPPAEARRIAEEDLAYLEALESSAQEALEAGLAPGWALLEVYAVEPPRATTPDFEIYDLRSSNARRVLDELTKTPA